MNQARLLGAHFLTRQTRHFLTIIPPIPGRTLQVASTGVIKPDSWACIKGEGMPVQGRPFDKGNLYIHFTGAWLLGACLLDCCCCFRFEWVLGQRR